MLRPRSAMAAVSLAMVLALFSLACSSTPLPAASPPPAITPIPIVPSSTVTPEVIDATPENGAEAPEPSQQPAVSLQPTALTGWDSPLIIARTPNATESGPILADGPVFVSWAITNKGPGSANKPFSVDLLVDGVPIERWGSKGLFVGETQSVRDWSDLPLRLRLTPGEHTLTLVVDSTGYLQQRDAATNSVTVSFEWPQSRNASAASTIAPQRLPNLSPYVPAGWESPINLQDLPQSEEALANPRDPSIQIAYSNSGLSSVNRFFLVHVYVDGVLVTKFNQLGLLAEEVLVTPAWTALLDNIHLARGMHSISIVLDPTDLVAEADESDNTATFDFFWGGAPVSSPAIVPTASNGPPSLREYVPTGWSGSLIVTSYPGRTGALGPVFIDSPSFASWAIRNDSATPMESPFIVELLLGGRVIQTWERPALAGGEIDVLLDSLIPFAPSSGVFEMTLRAAFSGRNGASTEPTVIARRTVGWTRGEAPASSTELLKPEEVARRLSFIEALRSTATPTTASPRQHTELMQIVDAVYQTLYQRRLRDEPLAIHVLSDAEFDVWVDAECREVAPTLDPSVQRLYLSRCDATKGFAGYHTSWRDAFRIVVKGDRSPMQVLSTIAHELGHFRQSLRNPDLNGQANLDILTLREAQAYAHQVLFIKTLESLTGLDLLLYPEMDGYKRYVGSQIAALRRDAESSEHARGQLVLWLALLADPNLRQERTILLNNLSIPATTARGVFDYLVDFSPVEARIYVRVLLRSVGAQIGAIESLALARLVPGLPYWNEGSPDLREIGLLLP